MHEDDGQYLHPRDDQLMDTITQQEWAFGGFLEGSSPMTGFIFIAALLLGAAGIAWMSYRHTLHALPALQRHSLFVLRTIFCLLLLLCLANPIRTERKLTEPSGPGPLAVLVDHSHSMTRTDNRGRSRMDEAKRTWHTIRQDAEAAFSKLHFHGFAEKISPMKDWESATSAGSGDDKTHLFNALDEILNSAPAGGYGAILCITDGIDTSQISANQSIPRFGESRTPLYFISGNNRSRPENFLTIRESRAPDQIRKNSDFNHHAVIEAFSTQAQEVPMELWQGDKLLARETLNLQQGHNVVPWSTRVTAHTPGDMMLELRLAWNKETPRIARHHVKVVEETEFNILYYQGALNWGFRYVSNVVKRDPGFRLTAVFNPAAGVKISSGAESNSMDDLPATASALAPFNLVILENVFANQLSKAQQQALSDYVKSGGGVLFLLPENEAAQAFSGQAIEEMLPVVFAPPQSRQYRDMQAERFQHMMMQEGGSSSHAEQLFALGDENTPRLESLVEFAFPDEKPRLNLFTVTDAPDKIITPAFSSYALVKSVKPAADVLAIHPTARDESTGQPHVLLAVQPYGDGRSGVLTTDPLWRWRMSLPSDSRDAEIFWQQLFHWLGKSTESTLRFTRSPVEATKSQSVSLQIAAPENASPRLTAKSAAGETEVALTPAGEPNRWTADWKAAHTGLWELQLTAEGHAPATAFISILEEQTSPDLADLPTATDLLKTLASSTGGELIGTAPPRSWREETREPEVISETRTLLWNSWPWLMAILGTFSAELLLRRKWKLL